MNVFEFIEKCISDEEIIKTIKKLDNINAKDDYGRTLLHEACYYGGFKVVKILVQRSANVNVIDNTDWTPLRYACYRDNFEIVGYLIEHGADVQNEFEYCFEYKLINKIKLLTKAGACFL